MRNIINNKDIIIKAILIPIGLIVGSVLGLFLFNVGTYLGTFIRNLYTIVVCL